MPLIGDPGQQHRELVIADTCQTVSLAAYSLECVSDRLKHGNISERIAARVRARAPRAGARQRDHIRGIYEELAGCLTQNEPWPG
jgi:hypothetical protein